MSEAFLDYWWMATQLGGRYDDPHADRIEQEKLHASTALKDTAMAGTKQVLRLEKITRGLRPKGTRWYTQ